MAVARLSLTRLSDGEVRLSDEVELYQRTYTTLLRSSGETHLRVLESSHRAMGSSLHPLAGSDELDLGAFIYAIRRLPDGIVGAELVVMGQDVEDLVANGIPVGEWVEAEAPARRRRWYDSGTGTLAVLMASASDVDDLVPTLVAFQIEWNKIRVKLRAAGLSRDDSVPAEVLSRELGGSSEDWNRLREAWGELFGERMRLIAGPAAVAAGADAGRQQHRLLAPDATVVGSGQRRAHFDAPLYFVSSNTHSIVNIVTGLARQREPELVAFVEQLGDGDILRQELTAFREGRTEGSWENFLYFVARLYFSSRGEEGRAERRAAELRKGITHLRSKTALRVPAQVIPLAALDPSGARPPPGRDRCRRAEGERRRARQHRLPARRGRVQHPAGGDRRPDGPARPVRVGKGRHAQRRRWRRDDLKRRPRRALGLHLLA